MISSNLILIESTFISILHAKAFFKVKTKVIYQNTEISAKEIYNKLSTKQFNVVFSRETKEKYARKTILFDQICSGSTIEQVSKVLSLNYKK